MKYITTILCCLAFAVCGVGLAISEKNAAGISHPSVSAATIPYYTFPKLPLDVQLDLDKKYKSDPEPPIRDTVFIKGKEIIKYKYKTKYVPAPDTGSTAVKPDSPNIPVEIELGAVKNKAGVVREEQTTDSVGPPKESIILLVDGKEVYKR